MNQYKLKLLTKQFPFIYDIAGLLGLCISEINGVQIKKGDENLLMETGAVNSYSWSGGGIDEYTKYFNVNHQGAIMEFENNYTWGTGSGESTEISANTIGEQLYMSDTISQYIVRCIKNDTDANGNGEVSYFWTIFKMKKFDLKDHHQAAIDKAAAELKAEIEAAFQE